MTAQGEGPGEAFEYLEAAAQSFDRAPLAMALIDLSGRPIWVNQAAERVFGYSQSELAVRAAADVGFTGEGDDDGLLLAEAAAGNIAAWERVKRVSTRGGPAWIHARYWVVRDHDDLPTFLVSQMTKLTDRQAAMHEALRQLAGAVTAGAATAPPLEAPGAEPAATVLVAAAPAGVAHPLAQLLPGWPPIAATVVEDASEEMSTPRGAGPDAFSVTLYEAAQLLSISGSTLRRWADGGRLACARTAGGHRRFRLTDIQRLRAERRQPSEVRMQPYPARPLPFVAATLERHASELATRIARCLYVGPPGWFETPESIAHVRVLLTGLARAFASGDFHDAQGAVRQLMHHAELGGASLAERHAFIQTFDAILRRQLREHGCPRLELGGVAQAASAMTYQLIADHDRELVGH